MATCNTICSQRRHRAQLKRHLSNIMKHTASNIMKHTALPLTFSAFLTSRRSATRVGGFCEACHFSGAFKYVMIVLKGSVPIAFGGTQEPAAYGELVSIGGLNPDTNKKLSAAIASILETKLSIPKRRFFLKFFDSKGSDFGWNGSTF